MVIAFDRAKATEDIRRIILTYPELIDRGNVDGVAELLDDVKMCNSNGIMAPEVPAQDMPTLAADQVREMYSGVIFYGDGLPHTKHVITDIDIWFSEDAHTANSRSFYVVLQGMEGFPLQVIITGRYEDTYAFEGGKWRLRIRREYADMVGDLSRHVKPELLAELLRSLSPDPMDSRRNNSDILQVETFRARVAEWLAANAPRFEHSDPADREAGRAFRVALFDAGLAGITLDPAYGGQGLTEAHQAALAAELARYALPPTGEAVTTGICAPTLLDFGSEEQKRRHIPRMLRGEESWTQLLSEPGAGSDLASLQTRAVRDGDDFVINGQKVWTSLADRSDYALCMARTDPDVPKHQGLSMFIVDLAAEGVTVRPLRQMTGETHFNEVFLEDVRIPASGLVGSLNDGWRALSAMLTHERLALGAGTGAGGSGQPWIKPASDRLIALARERNISADTTIRQELAQLYITERVLGLLGQRLRDDMAGGKPAGAKGSIAKLLSANLSRRSAALGMAVGGMASQAWDHEDWSGATLAYALCFSPMTAIAGGTSEIQRNTLGERVLNLPKELQVDRDVPFRQTRQNPYAPDVTRDRR